MGTWQKSKVVGLLFLLIGYKNLWASSQIENAYLYTYIVEINLKTEPDLDRFLSEKQRAAKRETIVPTSELYQHVCDLLQSKLLNFLPSQHNKKDLEVYFGYREHNWGSDHGGFLILGVSRSSEEEVDSVLDSFATNTIRLSPGLSLGINRRQRQRSSQAENLLSDKIQYPFQPQIHP
jgi:hypothetical protein